jgi:uncharacterized protein with PIN domain
MAIDSSALIALLLGEPETADFIAAASSRGVSAPTYLERAIVILARSGQGAGEAPSVVCLAEGNKQETIKRL